MLSTIPTRPWQRVGTDIFELDGKQYLILVDYYSNFFEVNQINRITSGNVIIVLKTHFARYGITEELISDNGT